MPGQTFKPGSTKWGFNIPPLPKETYAFVKQVCTQYDMTQRQVVVAGMDALHALAQLDRGKLEELLQAVKVAIPHVKPAKDVFAPQS